MVQPSIPVEDVIADELATVLQEEIDWELITDALVSIGWARVELGRFNDRYHAIDIQLWLDETCKGHYRNRGTTFMFQKPEEAEWFSLRWL